MKIKDIVISGQGPKYDYYNKGVNFLHTYVIYIN